MGFPRDCFTPVAAELPGLRPSKSGQAGIERLNVAALQQLRGDPIGDAEAVVRQANVKPGRGTAMLAHQARVGAAQCRQRLAKGFVESLGLHDRSPHREGIAPSVPA
jgi:hypothetical protein